MSFMGHVLMENRNGLAVDNRISQPGYHAEPDTALQMAQGIAGQKKKTIGGDKHYDQEVLTTSLREMNIASHAAQNIHPRRHTSSVDGRTTRHEGYEVSQRKRKRIEEIFGWLKTIGLMRRPMVRGLAKVGWMCRIQLGANKQPMRSIRGKSRRNPYAVTEIVQSQSYKIDPQSKKIRK